MAFLLVACLIHGSVLAADPALSWGKSPKVREKAIPVDFVAAAPSPLLAPVPASDGARDGIPGYGSGAYRARKVKGDSRKNGPSRKVRKFKKKRAQRRRNRGRRRILAKARRERRRQLVRERRERAQHRAAQKREQTRLRRERRVARARKRAELARELASLSQPDEALSDATPAGPAPAGGRIDPDLRDALADSDDLYDAQAMGKDDEDLRPAGGGIGQGGSDVSWSIEGAAGDRRLLSRSLPSSPSWVSRRGIDVRVRIRFQVRADGSVRDTVIRETSGFPELDRKAIRSLKRWRFEAISGAAVKGPETIGVVTFRFTV